MVGQLVVGVELREILPGEDCCVGGCMRDAEAELVRVMGTGMVVRMAGPWCLPCLDRVVETEDA